MIITCQVVVGSVSDELSITSVRHDNAALYEVNVQAGPSYSTVIKIWKYYKYNIKTNRHGTLANVLI